MITIKLSSEQMKEFGITSAEDIMSRLAPPAPAPAPTTPPIETQSRNDFTTLEARMTAWENSWRGFSADEFKKELLAESARQAKSEASAVVSAAIAKSGGQAIAPKETPVENPAPTPVTGDYQAQWDSNPNLRGEFVTFNSFRLYMEAAKNGLIEETSTKK